MGVCVCARTCVLVTQSCPTLCDPMDSSPPGSFVHRILQARVLEWVACHFLLQEILLTQGSNLGLPHCRQILYHLPTGSLIQVSQGPSFYADVKGRHTGCFSPTYPHGSVWQMCSLPVLVAQLRFYKDEILGAVAATL